MDKNRKLKAAGVITDFIFAATMITLLILFTVFAINTINYYNSADNTEKNIYAGIIINVSLYGGLFCSGVLFIFTAVFASLALADVVKGKKYGKNRRFGLLASFTAVLAAAPLVSCINMIRLSLVYLVPAAILLACVITEITLTCVARKKFPRKKDGNDLCE